MIERTQTILALAAGAWLTLAAWLILVAWLTLADGAQLASAQTPKTPPPPYGAPPQGPRFRDPTQPSPEVRQAMEATQAAPTVANPVGPVVPQIKLKAKLIGSTGQPVALLDVNGQLFTVYADSEIEVPAGSASKILVRELNATEVRVEMLPLKRMIILR